MFETSFSLQCFMSNFCFIKTNQIDDFVDEPYHIYFVISEAKSFFVPDSIRVSNIGIKCDILKDNNLIKLDHVLLEELNGGLLTGFAMSLSPDKSTLTVKYCKNFKEKLEFSITANQAFQMSGLCKTLNCNIVYIGQSYGHNGERTAAERLGDHKTLQRIMSDIICSGKDEEVLCLLTDFDMDAMLTLSPKTFREDNEQKFLEFLVTSKDWKKKQCIDIVEAGLINFFKPKYNEVYKKIIYRDAKNSKFDYLFSHHVDKIAIQFLPDCYNRSFINGIKIEFPSIVLRTDYASLMTNNPNQFIECDLNSKEVLKTELISY